MATIDNVIFHCGTCANLEKMIKFYKGLPNISGFNRLLYFEQYSGPGAKEMATERFEELSRFPWDLKASVIAGINPEFIELLPGVNVEII